MPTFRGPHTEPTKFLFVDAASLNMRFKDVQKALNEKQSLNKARLFERFDKIFYYDAIPTKSPKETSEDFEKRQAEKQLELSQVARIPNCHVRTGVARFDRRRGSLRQKAVDVYLAIEAFEHAIGNICDEIHLIESDFDFLPLCEALVRRGIKVHLYHDPFKTSTDLIEACDITTPLSASYFISKMRPTWSNYDNTNYSFHPEIFHEESYNTEDFDIDDRHDIRIAINSKIKPFLGYIIGTRLQIRADTEQAFDCLIREAKLAVPDAFLT